MKNAVIGFLAAGIVLLGGALAWVLLRPGEARLAAANPSVTASKTTPVDPGGVGRARPSGETGRAAVAPDPPPPADPPPPDRKPAPEDAGESPAGRGAVPEVVLPPDLRIRLDRRKYRHLDTLRCEVEIPSDGFLYLFAVWSGGEVYLLWPHEEKPGAKVGAGQVLEIPTEGRIALLYPEDGNGDFLTEHLFAVLAPQPIEDVVIDSDRIQNQALLGLDLLDAGQLLATRGGKRAKPLDVHTPPNRDWQTDSATYKILP